MAIGAILSGLPIRTMGFVEVVVAMLAAIPLSGIFSVLIGILAVAMNKAAVEPIGVILAGVLGGVGGGLLGSYLARIDYYVGPIKNYAVFSGRATRKEYWLFFFLNLIIYCLLAISEGFFRGFYGTQVPVISFAYIIALLTPSLAVTARRIHDVGKSAWWLLVGLIPVLGAVWLAILLMSFGSESGENEYGPNPHRTPTFRRRPRRRTIRE